MIFYLKSFLSQIFYEAFTVVFNKRRIFCRAFETQFKIARLDFVAGDAVGVAALVFVFELAVVSATRARRIFCELIRAVNHSHERRIAEIRCARRFNFFYRGNTVLKPRFQKRLYGKIVKNIQARSRNAVANFQKRKAVIIVCHYADV